MNRWKEHLEDLRQRAAQGETLDSIGASYGVSRQRMYQVFTMYGLNTPLRQRRNVLKNKEPKYYWLDRTLRHKRISHADRMQILSVLEIPDVCPVLGIELNYDGTGQQGFSRTENSPSIDQLDAGGGYTIDNIRIISWRANRIKNDGTASEHKAIAEWMTRQKSS